jgi:predicted enzyme related to lactoylglutathione lyase
MTNPVGWFEIYVDDLSRAKAFYEQVFDVRLSKMDNPDVELFVFPSQRDAPGSSGALVRMPGFDAGANSVLVYFTCGDCTAASARVVKFGGRIHKEKWSIGEHGFIALAFDTEGNMIGLHSMH